MSYGSSLFDYEPSDEEIAEWQENQKQEIEDDPEYQKHIEDQIEEIGRATDELQE